MLSKCKIGAIVFFVADLARSIAFYRDTLDLPVQSLDGEDGPWATADVGELTLVFIPRPATVGESPVVVFNIEGGIDDLADALAARGVEITVPVSEAPSGGLTLDFVDPDRNVLSLYQPVGAERRKT